jgi:hypothetical protein
MAAAILIAYDAVFGRIRYRVTGADGARLSGLPFEKPLGYLQIDVYESIQGTVFDVIAILESRADDEIAELVQV